MSSDSDDDDVHDCKTRSSARRSVDRSNSWCDDKRTGRRNYSVRLEDDDDDVDDNLNDGNDYPRRRRKRVGGGGATRRSGSRTSDSDDSGDRKRRHRLKPPKFDGTTSYETLSLHLL